MRSLAHRSLTALAVAIISVGPLASPAVGQPVAAAAPAGCQASLGPLSLYQVEDDVDEHGSAEVKCSYRNEDWSSNASVLAAWLIPEADESWLSSLAETYCKPRDPEDVAEPYGDSERRYGWQSPFANERYVLGMYDSYYGGPSVDEMRAAAHALAWSVGHLAAACPGADPPPLVAPHNQMAESPRTTTLVLTGELAAGLLAGGPGTVFEVTGDDRFGIVVGVEGEVVRDDYLGSLATLQSIDVAMSGPEGETAVLVTVTISDPPPGPQPIAAGESTEPEALEPEEPSEPEVAEPPAADEGQAAEAGPGGEVPGAEGTEAEGAADSLDTADPEDLSGLSKQARRAIEKLERPVNALITQIGSSGSGRIEVEARLIEGLAAVRPKEVTAITLRDGYLALEPKGVPVDVPVTPTLDPGTGEVQLQVPSFVSAFVDVRPLTDLARALNAGLRERGIRLTTIAVTEAGIVAEAERTD